VRIGRYELSGRCLISPVVKRNCTTTEILPLADPLAREFYAEMCRLERWSVRTLRAKIGSQLFLRTALSKKPAKLARRELAVLRAEDQLSPDLVFRDPYVLDFLGLKDTYAEKDLEAAILRDMEAFLLELGVGFAFVARQKRMTIAHVVSNLPTDTSRRREPIDTLGDDTLLNAYRLPHPIVPTRTPWIVRFSTGTRSRYRVFSARNKVRFPSRITRLRVLCPSISAATI
jgi:predicted nuclease of restriction endonuclease-like (RecB) superfamily